MRKKELRIIYRKKRSLLRFDQIQDFSVAVANRLIEMPIWHFSFYHIFLAISKNNELDTQPILSLLQGRDKNVVVPKTLPNRALEHYLLTDATPLKKNKWGIPEPQEGIQIPVHQIDVVFVPLLIHDMSGNRVGYGGGFYDTFLKRCRPETIKVGLSYFEAIESIVDVQESDVALDYCVTPSKTYIF